MAGKNVFFSRVCSIVFPFRFSFSLSLSLRSSFDFTTHHDDTQASTKYGLVLLVFQVSPWGEDDPSHRLYIHTYFLRLRKGGRGGGNGVHSGLAAHAKTISYTYIQPFLCTVPKCTSMATMLREGSHKPRQFLADDGISAKYTSAGTRNHANSYFNKPSSSRSRNPDVVLS